MFYLPLLFVCSLSMPDAGPNCIRYQDLTDAGYSTLRACEGRLGEMVDEIKLKPQTLWKLLPGPYRYQGHCVVPLIDEVVI